MCSYCFFKFTQQIISVSKVTVGTTLCSLITQFLHYAQVCSLTKDTKETCLDMLCNVYTDTSIAQNLCGDFFSYKNFTKKKCVETNLVFLVIKNIAKLSQHIFLYLKSLSREQLGSSFICSNTRKKLVSESLFCNEIFSRTSGRFHIPTYI